MTKSLRIGLLLLLCVGFVSSVSAKKKYPVLKFEQTTIDCGVFSQDEPEQVFRFKFTNTGNAKLVINAVHTACGCTRAEYPKDAISPGGSGVITVVYNAKGKMPGKWMRAITVFYNGQTNAKKLYIKGEMSSMPKEDLHRKSK